MTPPEMGFGVVPRGRLMSLLRGFLVSVVIGVVAVLALVAVDKYRSAGNTAEPQRLRDAAFVRGQVELSEVPALAAQGYRTIVSLRPDGEGLGQPSSDDMRKAAEAAGMAFAYIPTPKNEIPDAVANELAKVLAQSPRPALLYCRSGARAARVWALAEASRKDGLSASEIENVVAATGRKAEDLAPRISARIAARASDPSADPLADPRVFARE